MSNSGRPPSPGAPPPPRGGLPVRRLVIAFVLAVMGVLAIPSALQTWRLQNTGIPARVEVQPCFKNMDCYGIWRQSDGSERRVHLVAGSGEPFKTIDVRIDGDTARDNDLLNWLPGILIGVGLIITSLVILARVILHARRQVNL